MFLGAVEVLLRFVGVDRPASPRLVVRAIDIDISFPFMRPDRELFWSPIPGFRGEFLGETVTINSMGLRGAEVTVPKPKTKRRILCFGDSITFGYGVSDDETYAFHLGQALNSARIEVINSAQARGRGFLSVLLRRHTQSCRSQNERSDNKPRRSQPRNHLAFQRTLLHRHPALQPRGSHVHGGTLGAPACRVRCAVTGNAHRA